MKVENDVLLRCRQFINENERASMFRLYFHTSFINTKVLRFSKPMIDGVYNNDCYSKDFFIDLIFSDAPKLETDPECKDAFWDAMGNICKRKNDNRLRKNNIEEETKHTTEQVVPDTAFIIDENKEEIPSLTEEKKETTTSSTQEEKNMDEKEITNIDQDIIVPIKNKDKEISVEKKEEISKENNEDNNMKEDKQKEEVTNNAAVEDNDDEEEDVDAMLERIQNEVQS